MKVLSVTSELYPLIKTGGLADVTGALPAALAAQDIDVATLLPGYPAVLAGLPSAETIFGLPELFGGAARVLRGRAGGLDVLALDAPHLYDRPGNPYLAPAGQDWPDNAQRFAALAQVAAEFAHGKIPALQPDLLHLHDWQAGLTAAYVRRDGTAGPGIVTTVHNLAFQGLFPASLLAELGLPAEQFGIDGIEFHGSISFLKAGLSFADRITTVSPTYADEIRTPEGGMGMDGLLRARGRDVVGILNGIDPDVWDPEIDPLIPVRFGRAKPARRAGNKSSLQRRFGLAEDGGALLCGVVSRLTWQKGLDLLLEALPRLRAAGVQLAVLGTGEPGLQAALASAAARDPAWVGCLFTYDEALAHLMQAGADALLVPSRFEPCGLTQLCAMRYGCIPLVSRVGGLADTVIDANVASRAAGVATGVQFAPVTRSALEHALLRLADLWRDKPAWRRTQRNAMAMDVSWRGPAAAYATLFRNLQAAIS